MRVLLLTRVLPWLAPRLHLLRGPILAPKLGRQGRGTGGDAFVTGSSERPIMSAADDEPHSHTRLERRITEAR